MDAYLAPRASRAFHVAAVLLVCGVGVAVYSNSFDVPFVFDDMQNVAENPHVRISSLGWKDLQRAAFESPSPRPLANLSFALNHYWGGDDVFGFHAVNLAVHLGASLLVYLFALELLAAAAGRDRWVERAAPRAPEVALVAALIFVAHPIQTQAVTYVVQRMTSLAALFYLAALCLYVRGRRRRGAARAVRLAGAVLAWGLALATKQFAATLPLAIALYEWLLPRRRRAERSRGTALGAAAALAAVAAVSAVYLSESTFSYAHRDFDAAQRVWTELRVVVRYLGLVAWPLPSRLNLTHHLEPSRSLLDPPTTLLAGAFLAALLLLALAAAPRYRLASFAALWFFLHLAIESSVIPLELMYEHRLYLPMAGLAIAAATLPYAVLPGRPALARGACAALVLALALGSYARNETWRDPVSLWSDAVAGSPRHPRSRNNLGSALEQRGRLDEAVVQLREAVRLDPDYARARHNLAIALHRRGDLAEALEHYRAALRLEPGRRDLRTDLASALLAMGRFADAARHYGEALRRAPDDADAHYGLGRARVGLGRVEEALASFERAVRLAPDDARAHQARGASLAMLGRLDAAEAALRRVTRLAPERADGHVSLASVLARRGDREAAAARLETALRLEPGHAEARRLRAELEAGAEP